MDEQSPRTLSDRAILEILRLNKIQVGNIDGGERVLFDESHFFKVLFSDEAYFLVLFCEQFFRPEYLSTPVQVGVFTAFMTYALENELDEVDMAEFKYYLANDGIDADLVKWAINFIEEVEALPAPSLIEKATLITAAKLLVINKAWYISARDNFISIADDMPRLNSKAVMEMAAYAVRVSEWNPMKA